MIKPEEFENGFFLALDNSVEAMAHLSVGTGGKAMSLRKVRGVFWCPLDKQGLPEPRTLEALEKLKAAKTISEIIQLATEGGIVWLGGSL